jgi:hypothetical protein
MGSKDFRVERVPPPFPVLGSKRGGTLRRSEALAELGLKAQMEEWFQFGGVSFEIQSFEFETIKQGFAVTETNTGPNFSPAIRGHIRDVRAGSSIYFNDIKAVGPDGAVVTLSSLSYKIR